MSLKDKVDTDLKDALRAKDQLRLDVLRQVKTAIKLKEVEGSGVAACDDAQVLKIFAMLTKQRRDSIEQFTKGGRADLAAKEAAELAILESYLPTQINEAALRAVVQEVIAAEGATGAKDMGRVMKAVLARVAGQADGKLVSQLVKEYLGS